MVGLGLSNDTVSGSSYETTIDIAVGQCRDSSDVYDILVPSPIKAVITNSGFGGLDTGTVAASTVYAVIVVYDPVNGNPTGAMFTLSPASPLMPYGYSAWRVLGYVATDGSSHILKGQWTAGGTGRRLFQYDVPQATAVTAGNSTSLAAVDLSALVPGGILELPVNIYYAYTPASAGNAFLMQGYNRTSSGFATKITGQVMSQAITGNAQVIAELNASSSNKPEINYKVGNSSDAVAIDVSGYSINL